jgi:DNA repair protein RAD57
MITSSNIIDDLKTTADKLLSATIDTFPIQLYPGTITEIYGESATGKTQIALCLATQILPYNHVVYICTKQRFPFDRFYAILSSRLDTFSGGTNNALTMEECTERMHIIHIHDIQTQEHILKYQLPVLLSRFNVGLVVIDDIAANFRENIQDRTKEIFAFGNNLKKLAHDYKLNVLCLNQVSAVFTEDNSIEKTVKPALGNAWASIPNTRVEVKRFGDTRILKIVKSACHPTDNEQRFEISAKGIEYI